MLLSIFFVRYIKKYLYVFLTLINLWVFGSYKLYIHIKNFELALIIYSNGIVEEMIPTGDTFTHRDLVKSFDDYTTLETFRLPDVPNTWCLWGHIEDAPENEFNKIGTEIVNEAMHSHLILIHDSEINREWNITDEILQRDYQEWQTQLAAFTNELIEQLSRARQEEMSDKEKTSMIFLTTMGHTADKRVLFAFDPNIQAEDFYTSGSFDIFATKIYEYLDVNFFTEPIEESKPFVIFADGKTIVIVENEHMDNFINLLSSVYENREAYEICKRIVDIKATWDGYLKIPGDIKTETLDPSIGPPKDD